MMGFLVNFCRGEGGGGGGGGVELVPEFGFFSTVFLEFSWGGGGIEISIGFLILA